MEGKSRYGARNWGSSDHSGHSNSALEPALRSSVPEGNASGYQVNFLNMRAFSNRSAMIHESEPEPEPSQMEFSWFPQRSFLPTAAKNLMHHVKEEENDLNDAAIPPDSGKNTVEVEAKPSKVRKQRATNRVASKAVRPREPKKNPPVPRKKKDPSLAIGRREKKNQDDSVAGMMLDFSGVPAPVCSCTGVPRQCYRWGAGGWQSSCCTTSISEYPLPMSTSRPGARLAGRKMSIGAYGKLLQRLANEGQDLSYAVDLKNHWARHGTNKFVTIR